MSLRPISFADRYESAQNDVIMTGIQTLVRLPLEQARRDAVLGLKTAGFISGYRGSPLGGLDQELWRTGKLMRQHHIVFEPGINEDLAATAVWGSQQTNLFSGAKYDGVFAYWYGKAPGVDRSIDVFRHANNAGTMPKGGVLLLAGDDHDCKSSTLPSQSDYALLHSEIPILNPANQQEVLDYGLYGWAMSRFSGLWVSLTCLADTMDSMGIVNVADNRLQIITPQNVPMPPEGVNIRLGDTPLMQEERLRKYKLPAAIAFARANNLNRTIFRSATPKLALVASGKAYLDLRLALELLDIDDNKAQAMGLSLFKVAMPWPLDGETLAEFAKGHQQILVVEAKRNLIEDQLKAALYSLPDGQRPQILGKHNAQGQPLLPEVKSFGAATMARALLTILPPEAISDKARHYLAALDKQDNVLQKHQAQATRTPFYCSGCPHNTSTVVPEGSRGLAGIGCHYMVTWMGRNTELFSQMGGEGLHWVGQQHFTETPHVFVNLGDGTYYHSGLMAIRAAVAAKANITYKILFNDAVAMTGGQPVDGPLSPQLIAKQVLAEGVAKVIAVSDDLEKYGSNHGFPAEVTFDHRDNLDAVQKNLRASTGVTVIIYDQTCAAEKRRRRKRGTMPDPQKRLFINDAVCEGCGDCSTKSNCISVEPQETEFGRKRRINQSSCNKDYSCLKGFCPSFVTVLGGEIRREKAGAITLPALPTPSLPALNQPWNIVLTGIGGTGVTTIAAILGYAAFMDGKAIATLDMNGLAQKGGSVMSHIRIAATNEALHGARIAAGAADLLLAADIVVGASPEGMKHCTSNRTSAIINSHMAPTAAFVTNGNVQYDAQAMQLQIAEVSKTQSTVAANALAEKTLGDALYANMLLLGFAYQQGLVPVSEAAILQAIALNGTGVTANQQAFQLGRAAAHDAAFAEKLLQPAASVPLATSLADIVQKRSDFLTQYQNAAYAERYMALVRLVEEAEQKMGGGQTLTKAVARYFFKLMAYKDEYEVARLYSSDDFWQKLNAQFSGDFKLQFNLAPPLLSRRDPNTGHLQKTTFGPWMIKAFALLAKLRWLRGTAFDIFGYTDERRQERQLRDDYEQTMKALLPSLSPATLPTLLALANLPEQIRGFGHVKEANMQKAAAQKAQLLAQMQAPTTAAPLAAE